MKTSSISCRWFYRSFNVVLSLKKYQNFLTFSLHGNGLHAYWAKDTEKFIPRVILASQEFKTKICNILEKHNIRRKSIKLFYKNDVP